jgi:serine/threonine-protein kinase
MADDVFERALATLLAGDPVETPAGRDTALEAIRVLSAIGQTSRSMLFGAATPARERRTWGHLEIRQEIGRGTSGTVYRAWDTRLAREVALKLLDPHSASAHAALAEGRLLARVRHPHIVAVYGADTFDDVSGLWMELVEGESLDTILERDGPMSAADALLVGVDLASALAAVHAAGMLHRDVKARNVVRQHGGRLVLMDFGAGSGTEPSGSGVGTPLYMSPELLDGAPASVQSDIYGLGVLIYHLITRSYPVAAEDLEALKRAHRAADASVRFLDSAAMPAEVRVVIERACAADAARRYASARECEAALVDALGSILSDGARVVPTAARRWRRWRRAVMTTAAAVPVLLLAIWFGWNTGAGRAARRAAGWAVPPRSPLYFVYGGAIGIFEGGALRLLPGAHVSAMVLAVTERWGIRTLPGMPPWMNAVWFKPDGSPEHAPGNIGGVCCFGDGTTDGRFNYALRQDSTLLEPIGSRPLAPPAIHRYSLEWTEPTTLFELDSGPARDAAYLGIAYAGAIDAFVVGRSRADGRSELEVWSRDGRRLAQWPVTFAAGNVAVDPADSTIWVTRSDQNARAIHLVNLDLQGRPLGSFDIPKPFAPGGAAGLEFAWPLAK